MRKENENNGEKNNEIKIEGSKKDICNRHSISLTHSLTQYFPKALQSCRSMPSLSQNERNVANGCLVDTCEERNRNKKKNYQMRKSK
jgi:hypothetical protein